MPEDIIQQTNHIILRHRIEIVRSGEHHHLEASTSVMPNASLHDMQQTAQALQQAIEAMQATFYSTTKQHHELPGDEQHHPVDQLTAPAQTVPQASNTISSPTLPSRYAPTTLTAFFKAAAEYGYKAADIPAALNLETVSGYTDFVGGLNRLKELALVRDSEQPATSLPAHGFAEEISPYVQQQDPANIDLDLLAEIDEPDFGSQSSTELDESFAPDSEGERDEIENAEIQQQTIIVLAERRLQLLRQIQNTGTIATPDQRQVLLNLVIDRLGKDRAQHLVMAIWHPATGERLNAARTRALVEWSKEDDQFEQVVDQVLIAANRSMTHEV